MKKVQAHNHYGHRQRLKDRIRSGGYSGLQMHEVLEFLLTYTVPQKNTNQTAHNLLKTFGSFSKVLDASRQELMSVDGIGEESALFLNTLPKIFQTYQQSKSSKNVILNTIRDCIKYFRENIIVQKTESMYILCMNANNELLRVFEIDSNNSKNVSFKIRDLIENILPTKPASIIMFHTHPQASCVPSNEDIATTSQVIITCYTLGLAFRDHIIFNETEHFSFGANNILQKLFSRIEESLSGIYDKHSYKNDLNQNLKPFKYEE